MIYEKYTTAEKVSKQEEFIKSLKVEEVETFFKEVVQEKAKVVLSNDAFAICEMLELYTNTVRNR